MVDDSRQADRLMRQIASAQMGSCAARVALIENEVEDVQNCAQAMRTLLGSRQLEWNAGVLDALLGPADPLGHRRFGHHKRVGDFRGSQPAHRPQGQRNRRSRSQGRMAAHEEKDQRVVFLRRNLDGRRFHSVDRHKGHVGHLAFATTACRFAANVVGHPPEGDLRQPCAGIVWWAIARPLNRRSKRRLLNGVLRRCEVAKSSDNCPEHLRCQFAQQVRNV